jgi:diadenosine tetraphosphate (Ap4A) HIT family hydrolase
METESSSELQAEASERDDPVGACARGDNPLVMCELESGWAAMGDTQFLPGYSVLISRYDDVERLSDLSREQRMQFLADLDLLAAAVEMACEQLDPSFRRVNIEILGNSDNYVHANVFPRYEWEGPRALEPVWGYRDDHWFDELHAFKPGHEPLRAAITEALTELVNAERSASPASADRLSAV